MKETQDIVDETDDHEDEENIDEEMGLGFLPPTNDGIANVDLLTNEQNINELVKKACKVVVLFKRSPTKNDTVLQKYVKEEKRKRAFAHFRLQNKMELSSIDARAFPCFKNMYTESFN